jgi:hypothetical protein
MSHMCLLGKLGLSRFSVKTWDLVICLSIDLGLGDLLKNVFGTW